ncbi:DNA (cytosine-5)-methyltransferase 1 [Anoplophora glabripennis]|nr:DNA (cytosine-5)-methyltransferase 1 [Anoplophora glabripennis]
MVCSEVIENAECNSAKKIKTEVINNVKEEIKIDSPNLKLKPEKCIRCKQFLDSAPVYNGHPNNSNEEFIALTDEKLSLYTGKEENINENDEFPTHKITYFSVYDDKGHLCPFDSGLVESNVELFFSGYIKPVYEEDPSTNNGIPAHDLGPINEWWTAGYDGGERLPIGFSTAYAEYYLMDPSPEYESIFRRIQGKIKLTKMVIEFLLDQGWENPNYEDLVQHVESSGEYSAVEDTLLQNAQFICNQVVNYDALSTDDEKPLISLPCMRSLVKMAGVTFQKGKKMRKAENKGLKIKKGPIWTKAVTTNLVRDVFEHFFLDQIDNKDTKDDNKAPKKKRCGVCEACQSPDCGECNHCKDMLKFGGSGRSKQACKNRRCPNMAILDAELSDNEDETDTKIELKKEKKKICSKRILHNVKWGEKLTKKYKGNECYSSAVVGEIVIKPGDFVTLKPENPNEPLCIAKIVYMYDKPPQKFMFHGHLFCRGADTILGETSDPRELFLVDSCEDLPLGAIVHKAEVEFRKQPNNWFDLGGEINLQEPLEDDGKTFFYTKRLEENRFIDIELDSETSDECVSCKYRTEKKMYNTPIYDEGCIKWKNSEYKVGTGVFLKPDTYAFKNNRDVETGDSKENNVEESLYPEFYRKKSDNIKGSNIDTPEPFTIGLIEEIQKQNNSIKIKTRIFYRPENTISSIFLSHVKDLNFLYYTEEVITTSFENVAGKCYLAFGDNLESTSDWSKKGPFRFYFTESYNPKTHKNDEVPMQARRIGTLGKGKGGKSKGKVKSEKELPESPLEWGTISTPLKCMDVFAGCGGLSEGLHQSGIAEAKWAIEKEVAAAQAFRLNNPDCKVFTDDCNSLLKLVLSGQAKEKGLPVKGEVEMLVGGPPCQGFSGMNRFNAGQYSLFKNSLVVSFLSYCEYYRPKYFILENVRNFVSFKRSMVLKLTLRCLLAMGYQVTFGVLQAGHYGVPQTRRRLILMASAPGYNLPKYPEPLHVFNRRGTQLSFAVDGSRYYNGCEWTESAPYRTICVRDSMSDLPDIKNGCSKTEMPYDGDAVSHFQKLMRGTDESDLVRDHICKEMSPIVEARMSQIPTYPGADWRDLPNISVKLNDGTMTKVLRYTYSTKKQKKQDTPRGVCQCATGGLCDPSDRQFNTLIPWCLPHTADRHNHWAGLYGRLEWDGFFGTTITNPEPMGKQGRVLHPEQNRVVSVRECARSQGFPDRFKFFGNILDKHRQVGNAVPPPLGAALGREICKALVSTKPVKQE